MIDAAGAIFPRHPRATAKPLSLEEREARLEGCAARLVAAHPSRLATLAPSE
jgi:hypothetical protein